MSFASNVGKPWVEPGANQCEMVNPHHPDCECASCKAGLDVQCLEPAVGFEPECCNVRVCGACALQMEREDFVVTYRPETRFVIVHPEMGVFLGNKRGAPTGYGFWSKVNPTGQVSAQSWPNRAYADFAMTKWNGGRPTGVTTWPVIPDLDVHDKPVVAVDASFASPAACAAAGIEAWDPRGPDLNEALAGYEEKAASPNLTAWELSAVVRVKR